MAWVKTSDVLPTGTGWYWTVTRWYDEPIPMEYRVARVYPEVARGRARAPVKTWYHGDAVLYPKSLGYPTHWRRRALRVPRT